MLARASERRVSPRSESVAASEQPGYEPQIAAPPPPPAPAPIVRAEPPRSRLPERLVPWPAPRRCLPDPSQSPTAPGAARARRRSACIPAEPRSALPEDAGQGSRSIWQIPAGPRNPAALPPPRNPGATAALTTLPPSATPKDEFDLGIGYMQRKDYALAEETMRNFAQKYPADPLLADSQYWLGESFFQRQKYRDAAESFLGVTTKFGSSAKAPDALLRLGQSLAALNEKEAACAALGEVTRKYPRASGGVKQVVDREQKRVKC